MIKQLYIKNFTLIDELDIDLYRGFSVITGETGAGKSIVLGAIGLLLGQRADSKAIKSGADKCVIEAHFDLSNYAMKAFFEENEIEFDAEDTIVRRELTPARARPSSAGRRCLTTSSRTSAAKRRNPSASRSRYGAA